MMNETLLAYCSLSITKDQFLKEIEENQQHPFLGMPAVITNHDIINAIQKYLLKEITYEALVEWVNTIWFSDFYEYEEHYENCIASVMSVIEESDERILPELTEDECLSLIKALKENREV